VAKLNSTLNQKISGTEVQLEVDLDDMFGTLVPDSSSFRQSVGQAIIDKIRERTENNVDVNGKSLKKYSKTYVESDEFKAYGKSEGNVNMKLTGDMLGLMDIIDEKKNKIVIGWTDGGDAAKAYNHVTGDTVPKRNFFGLPQSDLEEIAAEFRDELPLGDIEPTSSVETTQGFLESIGSSGSLTIGQLLKIINGDE
jgi:hypothetical protein